MPSYNNFYPTTPGYTWPMQPLYGATMPQTPRGIDWVEGEVGARAFQIPAGWPANAPIALWDSTDQVIYLKSVNQMGMPNPMQKLRYTMEETPAALPAGQSGAMQAPDMSQYATKDELEKIRQEMQRLQPQNNQNGSGYNNGNRGGK